MFQKKPDTIERYFGLIKKYLSRRIAAKNKNIGARLDALLEEKAHNEKLRIPMQREFTTRNIFASLGFFAVFLIAAASIWIIRPDLYLPLIRLVAPPQVVVAELKGVTFTESGVDPVLKEIRITIGKEMDSRFVSALVKVSPKLDYDIALSDDKKEIVITPKEDLASGINYTVEVKPGLVFTDGSYMVSAQSWVIPVQAEFAVTSISPANNTMASFTSNIEVYFNRHTVEIAEFQKVFSIAPTVEGKFEKKDGILIFTPSKQLVPGTVYTVKISEGLQAGSETLKRTAQSIFTVNEFADTTSRENQLIYQGPRINFPIKIYNMTQGQQDALEISGIKTVTLDVYPTSVDKIQGIIEQIKRTNAVTWETFTKDVQRSKTQTLTAHSGTTNFELNDLGKGAFIVKATAVNDSSYVAYQLVLNGNSGTYAVLDSNQSKINTWTFDYSKLSPASGADVTIFECGGSNDTNCSQLGQQKTPNNGYVQMTNSAKDGYILTSFDGGVSLTGFGDIFKDWIVSPNNGLVSEFDSDLVALIQTNKPVYSSGEMIKFAAYIRQRSDGNTIPPTGRSLKIALCVESENFLKTSDSGDILANCLTVSSLTLDENGKAMGEFPIVSGRERLSLRIIEQAGDSLKLVGKKEISVVSKERLKFSIEANLERTQFIFGDKVIITGRLTDYLGNGVPSRTVSLSGLLKVAVPSKNTSGKVQSNELNTLSVGNIQIPILNGITDSSGNFLIEVPINYNSLAAFTYKANILISFQDGADSISTSREIMLSRGNDYVVRAQQDGKDIAIANETKNASIRLHALSLYSGDSVVEKKATISVKRSWSEQQVSGTVFNKTTKKNEAKLVTVQKSEQILSTKPITFTANGEYAFDIKDLKEGQYSVTITDPAGGSGTYDLFTIFDKSEGGSTLRVNSFGFSTGTATPGEKISLIAQGNFGHKAREMLLLVETNKLLNWSIIDVTNNAFPFEVSRDMIGGVRACLVYPVNVQDIVDGTAKNLGHAIDDTNCSYLSVEDSAQQMTVKITSEKETYQPGDTVNGTIEITDREGKPVSIEAGITVVDKNLQEIGSDSKIWPENLYENYFAATRSNFPKTALSSSYDIVINRGVSDSGRDTRTNGVLPAKISKDSPLWTTSMRTDNSGKANFSFALPKTSTIWGIYGFAISRKTQVGNGSAEISAKRDIYLAADIPKFIRKGDTLQNAITVVNNSTEPFDGTLAVSCDTCLDRPNVVSILIPSKSTSQQLIPLDFKESHAKVTAELKDNDAVIDRVEFSQNIRSASVQNTGKVIAKVTENSSKIEVNLGKGISKESSSLNMTLSKTPFSGELLTEDPENISTGNLVGSILHAVYVYKNSEKLGLTIDKELLLSKIKYNMGILLERQKDSGEFETLTSNISDVKTMVQVARLFNDVRTSDPEVSSILPSLAAQKLETYLISALKLESKPVSDRILLMQGLSYVNKDAAVSYVTTAFTNREKLDLSPDDKLTLAVALFQVGDSADASYLVNVLNNLKVTNGNVAYVPFSNKIAGTAELTNLNQKMHNAMLDQNAQKQYQNWLSREQIIPGNEFEDQVLPINLYESLEQNTLPGTATIKAEIIINGKSLGQKELKEESAIVNVERNDLRDESNTIEIKVSGNKQIFATVLKNVVSNETPASQSGNLTIKQEVINLSRKNHAFSVGDVGYVKLIVSTKENVQNIFVRDYIPAGFLVLPAYSQYIPDEFISIRNASGTTLATINSQNSDFVQTHIGDLKHGTSKIVIYPVIAARKGIFGNHVTYVGNDLLSGSTVAIDSPLEIK